MSKLTAIILMALAGWAFILSPLYLATALAQGSFNPMEWKASK